MAGEKILPLCPRCGTPYVGIHKKEIGGRAYLYAYHGKQGKKPVYCYLGPADSYVHVESVLPLSLRSLEDVDLVAVAYNAALLYAARARRGLAGEKREAAERLKRLAEDILKLAEDLARG